jgi:hypothetical protein
MRVGLMARLPRRGEAGGGPYSPLVVPQGGRAIGPLDGPTAGLAHRQLRAIVIELAA